MKVHTNYDINHDDYEVSTMWNENELNFKIHYGDRKEIEFLIGEINHRLHDVVKRVNWKDFVAEEGDWLFRLQQEAACYFWVLGNILHDEYFHIPESRPKDLDTAFDYFSERILENVFYRASMFNEVFNFLNGILNAFKQTPAFDNDSYAAFGGSRND